MIVRINYTPFRHTMRPLSLYSERDRSDDSTAKVKWKINKSVRIFGYQQPDLQTRLTIIRLNEKNVTVPNSNCPNFLAPVPTTRGMGTATSGDKIVVETEPGREHLTIYTDDFCYNIEKIQEESEKIMSIKQHFLPMKQIKIRGSMPATILRDYLYISPAGPLRLKIRNKEVKLITESDTDRASLDITNYVTVHSIVRKVDYLYELSLLQELFKKIPRKEQIEIIVDDNLIRLRYEIGDDVGYVDYYQRVASRKD